VCVLLVEDEFLIRLLVAEELVHAGFAVCDVADGTQAAALIENPPAPFCLLITDIHMPGQWDGMRVAQLMRARFPDIPIIYTTGRPEVLAALGPLGARETLIPKPFVPSELLAAVRQMLSAGKADRAQ
jgi:DNA-binding response OmpR family regulator